MSFTTSQFHGALVARTRPCVVGSECYRCLLLGLPHQCPCRFSILRIGRSASAECEKRIVARRLDRGGVSREPQWGAGELDRLRPRRPCPAAPRARQAIQVIVRSGKANAADGTTIRVLRSRRQQQWQSGVPTLWHGDLRRLAIFLEGSWTDSPAVTPTRSQCVIRWGACNHLPMLASRSICGCQLGRFVPLDPLADQRKVAQWHHEPLALSRLGVSISSGGACAMGFTQ